MRLGNWAVLGSMSVLLAGGSTFADTRAEDDLKVVKKAVGSETPEAARPATRVSARADVRPAADPVPEEKAPVVKRRSGGEPRWLRVRIVEKHGARRNRVSVNLPFSLVRAVVDDGDDWPVSWNCRGRSGRRCDINLRDVLASLESGQELVEVDDEDNTVRVWVD
jgi:hypothetical protein